MNKIYLILLLISVSSSWAKQSHGDVVRGIYSSTSPDTAKSLSDKLKNYQDIPDTVLLHEFSRLIRQKTDAFKLTLQEQKKSLVKQKLKFYLTAENIAGIQTTAGANPGRRVLNQANIEGGINFIGIPLGFEYTNSYSRQSGMQYTDNLFRINFDNDKFSKTSTVLKQPGGLQNLMGSSDLSKEIKYLISNYFGSFDGLHAGQIDLLKEVNHYISDPDYALELLELKESDLRARLEGMFNKQAANLNKKSEGARNNITDWHRKLDSILVRVDNVKRELKKIGWEARKIRAVERYFAADNNISMSDVTEFNEIIGLPNRYLIPVFSKIRALKMGAFGNSLSSSMSNHDLLMKGAHVSVLTGRGPVTVGYGRNSDLDLVKDAGMENSVYSSPQKLAYLSVGINNSNYLKGKFTWINSISSGQLNERFNVSSLPRNTVGLTINQTLNLSKISKLNFDLSKSANIYRNALEEGAERILERRNFFNDYLFDSSFQTLAVGVSHQGEITPWNVSDNFYLNYSGLGYQNPVVTGISPVRLKFGGNLKKGFLSNKISLNLRTDIRNTPVNSVSDDKWKNYQFQLDTRFRISRKYNFSLKYSENGMAKQAGGTNTTLYSSSKFQVSANASYKLWKYHSSSNINIAYQNLSNMQLQTLPGNFMNVNYSHSMVLGQSSLSANIFYNKEMSAYELIGDMINGEISYQYVFMGELNLSTAVNYFENNAISKQYGIRQSLQLLAAKNFDFNASADIRKNLIVPVYPDLYPACQVELSLKYYLNK